MIEIMYTLKKNTNVPKAVRQEMFEDAIKIYKESLAEKLDNDPNNISEWIESNLISEGRPSRLKGDSELAFFAAEKALLKDFMVASPTQDNLDKSYDLIFQFTNNHHELTLARELDVFYTLIDENKKFFLDHISDYKTCFQKIGHRFKEVIADKYDSDSNVSVLMDKMAELVGELVPEIEL